MFSFVAVVVRRMGVLATTSSGSAGICPVFMFEFLGVGFRVSVLLMSFADGGRGKSGNIKVGQRHSKLKGGVLDRGNGLTKRRKRAGIRGGRERKAEGGWSQRRVDKLFQQVRLSDLEELEEFQRTATMRKGRKRD